MLQLMYITNDPQVAKSAQDACVDRIFVDLETIGKDIRQAGMNTVKSNHTVADIVKIREVLTQSKLLVRINSIYSGSKEEIDAVIDAGADIIMLPYFQSAEEVREFLRCVNGRVRTMLLFETPAAVSHIDEILSLDGIDECFIGLNDLHLGYQRKFMFELLADGTVEQICRKFAQYGKPYGFGGIARVGTGMLSADKIIGEHVRLGSSAVILSRSFCNTNQITDYEEIAEIFHQEVPKVRAAEEQYQNMSLESLAENQKTVKLAVNTILENMK